MIPLEYEVVDACDEGGKLAEVEADLGTMARKDAAKVRIPETVEKPNSLG